VSAADAWDIEARLLAALGPLALWASYGRAMTPREYVAPIVAEVLRAKRQGEA
jgi:hypothetical protein